MLPQPGMNDPSAPIALPEYRRTRFIDYRHDYQLPTSWAVSPRDRFVAHEETAAEPPSKCVQFWAAAYNTAAPGLRARPALWRRAGSR
jgi:hypothetical protein